MQTDIWMTILFYIVMLFYSNVYGKREIEREKEHYRLLYENISGFQNVRNFLSYRSIFMFKSL